MIQPVVGIYSLGSYYVPGTVLDAMAGQNE